ncbi:hypothetical protein RLPCCGM1_c1603 [Rhizobium leguminosarum bv. phaseoli CCGM1]|nr:hypothetical protein RLPCCGM1_c1603 [Rhizobium leguminosarum bv. phaseoli CCGM1]
MFGHAGAKVLVFPTREGRFFEYEQLGIVASLADKLQAGHLQLYCIEVIIRPSASAGMRRWRIISSTRCCR